MSQDKDVILVAESVRWGHEHQPFDTSFLLTCSAAYPSATIIFCAEQKHIDAVRGALPEVSRFKFVPIAIPERHSAGFARLRGDWCTALSLRGLIRKNNPKAVFLTSVTRELLWSLKILNLWNRFPGISAVIHAGLFSALRRPRFNFIARALSLRTAMLFSGKIVRFLVLERSIHQAVENRDPQLADLIGVLPHPLPPDLLETDLRPAANISAEQDVLKVGLLGLCTPQKGLFRFLELAQYARSQNVENIQFEIVGRLHKDVVDKAEPYLQYLSRVPDGKIIARQDFVDKIAQLDFAVFLFDGDYYEVTASGVLLDCIALGIPLIAEKSSLINILEFEAGGPIGITGESNFTRESLLERLQAMANEDYLSYKTNISSLRLSRTPESLAQTLLGNVS